MNENKRKYLYGYDSEQNSFLVEDYPWGFRLRTEKRYWVETSLKKGQRYCSQTKDPKTGRWCSPKKSTYTICIVLYLDEEDFCQIHSIGLYSSQQEAENFREIHKDKLTQDQHKLLIEHIAFRKVTDQIKYTVEVCPTGPVDMLSNKPEDIKKREEMQEWSINARKERDESLKNINKAIAYEVHKMSRV